MQYLQHQLRQLKLSGLQAGLALQQQQPAQYQELTFEERLSLLVEQEISQRETPQNRAFNAASQVSAESRVSEYRLQGQPAAG